MTKEIVGTGQEIDSSLDLQETSVTLNEQLVTLRGLLHCEPSVANFQKIFDFLVSSTGVGNDILYTYAAESLSDWPEDARQCKPNNFSVLSHPVMTLVRTLDLTSYRFTASELALLGKNESLRGITSLNLKGCGISAEALESLFAEGSVFNQSLTGLNVAKNSLTDASVKFLCTQIQLRSLNLQYTKVTDEGMIKLAKALSNLEVLDVSGNSIRTRGVKAIFAHCKRLKSLNLNDSHFLNSPFAPSDDVSKETTDLTLPELLELRMSTCVIREDDVAAIFSLLPKLEVLEIAKGATVTDLVGVQLAEHLPKTMRELTVHFVNEGGWAITDFGSTSVVALAQSGLALEALDISADAFSDDCVRTLVKNMPTLKRFVISGVSSAVIVDLSHLPKLEELSLRCFDAAGNTSVDISALADFKKLNKLTLSGVKIGNAGLSTIAKLSGLHELRIAYCGITDNVSLLEPLNKLRLLDISRNKIGDKGAAAIARLQALEVLLLGKCFIGLAGVQALSDLVTLRKLTFHRPAEAWFKGLDDPEFIDELIGDAGVEALAQLPNLEDLVLYNHAVTDVGAQILAGMSSLEWLKLRENRHQRKKMTAEGVKSLLESGLEGLVVDTRVLSGKGVADLDYAKLSPSVIKYLLEKGSITPDLYNTIKQQYFGPLSLQAQVRQDVLQEGGVIDAIDVEK